MDLGATMAFIDTTILIRHPTGDPPELAARATRFLGQAEQLLLADLGLAEMVDVLESSYEVDRHRVAELARSVVAFPAVKTVDEALLLRTAEVYEAQRLDFADAYLVASVDGTCSTWAKPRTACATRDSHRRAHTRKPTTLR